MAQTIDGSDAQAQRANELYWSDSMTVDDIVTELGISRSSLYASIEPAPAGLICTDCQERMVHTNRTMRERGVALCPGCGRESAPGDPAGQRGVVGAPEGGEEDGYAGAGTGPDDQGPSGAAAPGLDRWVEALRSVPPMRLALVGGAAGIGLILGAAVTRALRG